MACEKKTNKESPATVATDSLSTASEEEFDKLPLHRQLDILLVEIDSFKNMAFASEQIKVKSGKMLLEEVEASVKKYDFAKLNELRKLHQAMEASLYTEAHISDSTKILAYDAATEKFINKLKEFVEQTPEFMQHARARLLLNEVLQADVNDFMIRKNYDEAIYKFNRLLRSNAQELEKLGGKYKKLSVRKTFYGDEAL
ncbi:MAG: hypothetical protein NZ521_07440, partial [Flammeovirgaceae bacterium]|nr:hypothetical protein [Flammeovirgaceae bacterium]